jgi:uncharacterized protein (DUF1778 family)
VRILLEHAGAIKSAAKAEGKSPTQFVRAAVAERLWNHNLPKGRKAR